MGGLAHALSAPASVRTGTQATPTARVMAETSGETPPAHGVARVPVLTDAKALKTKQREPHSTRSRGWQADRRPYTGLKTGI